MRLSTLIAAVSGAIAGSVITYFVMRSKSEEYIQNEIDKYKEESGRTAPLPCAENQQEMQTKQSPAQDYISTTPAYVDYNKPYVHHEEVTAPSENKMPYEITFEEFDADDEFMKDTFMVWPDGYVTDTADNIISDIDQTVGRKVLSAILDGDILEGYVRNEELRMDFELIRAKDNYEDVVGVHPEED